MELPQSEGHSAAHLPPTIWSCTAEGALSMQTMGKQGAPGPPLLLWAPQSHWTHTALLGVRQRVQDVGKSGLTRLGQVLDASASSLKPGLRRTHPRSRLPPETPWPPPASLSVPHNSLGKMHDSSWQQTSPSAVSSEPPWHKAPRPLESHHQTLLGGEQPPGGPCQGKTGLARPLARRKPQSSGLHQVCPASGVDSKMAVPFSHT